MMLAADTLGIGSPATFADSYGQKSCSNGASPPAATCDAASIGHPREGDKRPTPKPRREDRVLRF